MTVFQHVRYALRRLRRRPTFVIVAVLTLTLGIGLNTVIFNFVNFLLFRPLPIAHPGEVVSLSYRPSDPGVSYPNYLDIRNRNQAFSHVAAVRVMPMHMSLGGKNARIWGYLVTGNYFELLGIAAWRGRLISESDDLRTGAHPVAVISYGYWQRQFGADPDVLGRTIRINGYPFTILGVTPPGFIGTEILFNMDIWVPFSMIREIEGRDWRTNRNTQNAWTIARLKPGMTIDQAAASLRVLAGQMAREHPDINEGLRIELSHPGLLGKTLRGPVIGISAALLLVAGLMLLVACTNLSGLLLAQAADRRKEFAIRQAVGAGHSAIVRMVLAESFLLATAGGSSGLLLASWLRDLITAWLPSLEFPVNMELHTDWRVLGYTVAISLFTVLLFGTLPALRAPRVDLVSAIKSEQPSERFRRFHLRDAYVALQVALGVVLLAGSFMMIRTLQRALAMNFGFNPDRAVALRFDLDMQGYSKQRGSEFQRRLLDRVRAMPEIEAASLANTIPFSIDQSSDEIYIEGKPIPRADQVPSATTYVAAPSFFRAMGTRLMSGRDFTERDGPELPQVAIVNETFAKQLLPGEDPIGKRFRFGLKGDFVQIVGVVEAGKYQTITEDPQPAVWRPLAQAYNGTSVLLARTRLDEHETLTMLRRSVEELDPELPVYDAKTLGDFLAFPMIPLRLTTASLSIMGGLAVFLCALGLYGLLAYNTAQRTHEIGIRVALGARPRDVLRVVLGRTVLVVGLSTAMGVVLSLSSNHLLGSLLRATPDTTTYLLATSLIAGVSAVACLIPARRATKVDPMVALRYE